jgi:hypothetical protein
MATLSSVWIGYGCRIDESLWHSEALMDWLCTYCGPGHVEFGHEVLMMAVATTTKIFAEFRGLIALPAETVFALDSLTTVIPEECQAQAQHDWECFRQAAHEAGFSFPEGRWWFAHLYD